MQETPGGGLWSSLPLSPPTPTPRASQCVPCHHMFPRECLSCQPSPTVIWFPVAATVPGVFLTQCCFCFWWFVLNAFSVPSGTRDKRIVYKKVGCVRSRAAWCVFLANASPEQGLKPSPFKMFLLILESDLNKIAL